MAADARRLLGDPARRLLHTAGERHADVVGELIWTRLGQPFADDEFDYLLCFETLEHVESPHEVLTELARVCRPGGRVFISIPWVPTTTFHPRDPSIPRGYQHVCELAHDDFHALVTHTPLQVVWEDVCWMLGKPRTLEQRVAKLASRG